MEKRHAKRMNHKVVRLSGGSLVRFEIGENVDAITNPRVTWYTWQSYQAKKQKRFIE